jgi:hypothetical protein
VSLSCGLQLYDVRLCQVDKSGNLLRQRHILHELQSLSEPQIIGCGSRWSAPLGSPRSDDACRFCKRCAIGVHRLLQERNPLCKQRGVIKGKSLPCRAPCRESHKLSMSLVSWLQKTLTLHQDFLKTSSQQTAHAHF